MNFAHPVWLILLVLPPLLGAAAVVASRLRGGRWAAFVAPRLRASLIKHGGSLPHWFALIFLLAACAAMIVAMARPQGDAGTRTEKSLGRNVLIALDLSRSMRVQDVKPDRLSRAKMTIYELLDALPNERIGLIGFAGNAYVYAPLTVDHGAVRETVEQIDETWTTRGGSNLGEAIRLAIETLKETGQKNNALVILSDGEKHDDDLDDLIDEAKQAGVYIVAMGVGTEDGDYVPNPDFPQNRMVDRQGQPVISRLQTDVLRRLAGETRGRFAVASSGAGMADMVQDVVKDLDTFEIQGRERAVAVEFYQWLLLPGILFMMVSAVTGTRWRSVRAAILIAGAFLTIDGARADDVSEAKRALHSGDYGKARAAYRKLAESTPIDERRARFRLGEAAAATRAGDFRAARDAYSGAMLSQDPEVLRNSHLGIGRSLFQLGWLELDDKPYPSDVSETPPMEEFDELVRKKLAAMRESGEPADAMRGMRSLIVNWTDAVRHFDSAGPLPDAAHNREVTMTYLNRLRELLEEDRQQTEDSLPQPQPGEGQPQEGEPQEGEGGEPKDQGEGGKDEPRESGEGGEKDGEPREGDQGEEREPGERNGKPEPKDNSSGKEPVDPNESPEERARRILGDNTDLEKGAPIPGRVEFIPPEKDW